ncbi:MAG TPA: hypothetical protein VGO48_08195 [Conexibacter sp.]|jgi:hypothetical protein|nr:hypothetical protein [Conexibacter sp.]
MVVALIVLLPPSGFDVEGTVPDEPLTDEGTGCTSVGTRPNRMRCA